MPCQEHPTDKELACFEVAYSTGQRFLGGLPQRLSCGSKQGSPLPLPSKYFSR